MTLPSSRRRAPEGLEALDAHPLAHVPDAQLEDLTGVNRQYFRARRRELGIPPQPKGHVPWLTNLVRSWPRAKVQAWLDSLNAARASVLILRRRAEVLLERGPWGVDKEAVIEDRSAQTVKEVARDSFDAASAGALELCSVRTGVDASEGVPLGGPEVPRLHADARLEQREPRVGVRPAAGEGGARRRRRVLPVRVGGETRRAVGGRAAAVLPGVPGDGEQGGRDVRGTKARAKGRAVGGPGRDERLRAGEPAAVAGEPKHAGELTPEAKPERPRHRGRFPTKLDENGQLLRVQRSWPIKKAQPEPLVEDGSDQLEPLTNAERALLERERPKTRGDCAEGLRPCPWASCRHHLLFEVSDSGTIHLASATLDPLRLENSCSLDVAERGGLTLEELGALLNLTRERVRQIETDGVEKLRRPSRVRHLADYANDLLGRDDETIYFEGDDE